MGQLTDLLREALARGDAARYVLRATDPDAGWVWQGECCRLLGIAIAQVEALEDAAPPPEPTPAPTAAFVCPVPNGGVFGPTKWLGGSLGCDVFVPRGTAVVAPAACVVASVLGGTGLSGGAEVILTLPDRAWAWRWRHVQAGSGIRVGMQVPRGTTVATVNDSSLDALGAIPQWAQQQAGGAFPDGWQHLDLSVNQGTDRFAPTGGGGGNVSAYDWLVSAGYQGRVLARTPGPPDAGMRLADAIALMTPQGGA